MHSLRKQEMFQANQKKKSSSQRRLEFAIKYNEVPQFLGSNQDLSVRSIFPEVLNTSSILADVTGIVRYFLATWDRIGNSEDLLAQ